MGLKQSASLILGKKKVERKKLTLIPITSGGGLIILSLIEGCKGQMSLKYTVI